MSTGKKILIGSGVAIVVLAMVIYFILIFLLRVVDTAGHSPGHISLFSPSTGILFCGDSMVTDEQGIHGSRPIFTWDPAMAQEAVRKQAALGARILCSGHGPVIMDAAGKFPI